MKIQFTGGPARSRTKLRLVAMLAVAIAGITAGAASSAVATAHSTAHSTSRSSAIHISATLTSSTGFQLQSDGGLCLNANNTGSTAGKNGDKIQLWSCNHNSNDTWSWGRCVGTKCQLINGQYPSMCLNANYSNGLTDGSKVQLWSCNIASPYNGLWVSIPGYLIGNGYSSRGTWLMTAQLPGFKSNGDQVQIWNSQDEGQCPTLGCPWPGTGWAVWTG